MIAARRAAVRPRVLAWDSAVPGLLTEAVATHVAAGRHGAVVVSGPPGSGKTTALQHIAAEFPHLPLLDEPPLGEVVSAAARGLVVYTAVVIPNIPHLAEYELAPWGEDERIEFLGSLDREAAARLWSRLTPEVRAWCGGSPALNTFLFDLMADANVQFDPNRAVVRRLRDWVSESAWEAVGRNCLSSLTGNVLFADVAVWWNPEWSRPEFAAELARLIRFPEVRMALVIDFASRDIRCHGNCDFLNWLMPPVLRDGLIESLRGFPEVVEILESEFRKPNATDRAAVTAHFLLRLDPNWKPAPRFGVNLSWAELDGARWAGVGFRQARLHGTKLRRADLTEIDLSESHLGPETAFDDSRMTRAKLDRICGTASFRGVDVSGASFVAASIYQADWTDADLTACDFANANVSGNDFSRANVRDWTAVAADLSECDLEYRDLGRPDFRRAKFQRAYLTGSRMTGGDLSEADFGEAGLAEVEWEGVNLCYANFQRASFHLGTTRGGLVGSPIACEGSRTGFYTDDRLDMTHRPPEEIRKANLCGCDLRGAKVDGTDFYLVDLRGAKFNRQQADHFRACGAILD